MVLFYCARSTSPSIARLPLPVAGDVTTCDDFGGGIADVVVVVWLTLHGTTHNYTNLQPYRGRSVKKSAQTRKGRSDGDRHHDYSGCHLLVHVVGEVASRDTIDSTGSLG